MCHTLFLSTVSSACTLSPKHVVQTKVIYVCDERLALTTAQAERLKELEGGLQSCVLDEGSDGSGDCGGSVSIIDSVETGTGTETETETGYSGEFVMVEDGGVAQVQAEANVDAAAAVEEVVEVQQVESVVGLAETTENENEKDNKTEAGTYKEYCDEEYCTLLADFGSSRVHGECAFCDSGEDTVLLQVVKHREGYLGSLYSYLVS